MRTTKRSKRANGQIEEEKLRSCRNWRASRLLDLISMRKSKHLMMRYCRSLKLTLRNLNHYNTTKPSSLKIIFKMNQSKVNVSPSHCLLQ